MQKTGNRFRIGVMNQLIVKISFDRAAHRLDANIIPTVGLYRPFNMFLNYRPLQRMFRVVHIPRYSTMSCCQSSASEKEQGSLRQAANLAGFQGQVL